MQLTILGCSGGVGSSAATTSFLVDDSVLLDAGTGASELPTVGMAELQDVFLTHAHLDHVALLPLMLATAFEDLSDPLRIHARPETVRALETHIFNWQLWPDFTEMLGRQRSVVDFQAMEPGDARSLAAGTITMLPVVHSVPAAGYLLNGQGQNLAFSGDCTTNEVFWQSLNELSTLDHLIVEVGLANEKRDIAHELCHYTPELLARDLEQLVHDPVIWLTHITPGDEQRILAQCRQTIQGRDVRLLQRNQVIEL